MLDAEDAKVWNLTALKHFFGSDCKFCRTLLSDCATCAAWHDSLLDVLCNLSHEHCESEFIHGCLAINFYILNQLTILEERICLFM